jgi:GT2 family glycosyltransferase
MEWALKHQADFILILNNDTEVTKNFLRELVHSAQKYPEADLFSPQLRYPGTPPKIWYAGGRMFWPIASLKLYKRGVEVKKIKKTEPFEINFVTGAAFFVSAKAIREIGKFDPKYFLYWEETDWCAKAQRAGIKFMYIPSSIVYHKEAATTGGPKNAKMFYYFYRNNFLFAKRNMPFYWWPTFILFTILRIFLIEFPVAIVFLIALKPYRLIGFYYIWLGIFDFIRGKFGRKF